MGATNADLPPMTRNLSDQHAKLPIPFSTKVNRSMFRIALTSTARF